MFVFTLSDIVNITAVVGIITIFLIYHAVVWIKHSMCKHDEGVRETRACDAICRKCGKNLGFIGSWKNPE